MEKLKKITIEPVLNNDQTGEPKATLEELKEFYLQHLRLKNFSPFTISQAERDLRIFFRFLYSQGIYDLKKVDMELMEEYKRYLFDYRKKDGRPLVVSTIINRLAETRKLFGFLYKRSYLLNNPTRDLELPKDDMILPRGIMTINEVNTILKQPDLKTLLGYRDRTMMEVLYSTGIRAGELVNLKVSDVDFEKRVLRIVRGKGGRDRVVPLNRPTCRFLARYLEKIRPELAKIPRPSGRNWEARSKTQGEFLFLTINGGTMQREWLNQLLSKYIKRSGIKKKVTPCHSFRHSIATHLLEEGMDIRYVQAFLGHRNIHTTERYTHVETKTLKELFLRYHPRDTNRAKLEFKPFKGEVEYARDRTDRQILGSS